MSNSLYEHAIRLLARRAYSRRELGIKLRRKGSVAATSAVLDRLTELGYLNDEQYAWQRAVHRRLSSAWGDRRIRLDLKRRGLDARIVARTVAMLEREHPQAEALSRAVQSWIRAAGVPETISRLKRLFSHCQRLGFPAEMVRDALQEYFRTVDWEQ